jgi:hypothetical protein
MLRGLDWVLVGLLAFSLAIGGLAVLGTIQIVHKAIATVEAAMP